MNRDYAGRTKDRFAEPSHTKEQHQNTDGELQIVQWNSTKQRTEDQDESEEKDNTETCTE